MTSVRAVSRCGGHRGQKGWGDKGLGSEEWSQQGKTSRQRSLDEKESIQEQAGCGRREERVLLLREEGPGEIKMAMGRTWQKGDAETEERG